MFFTDVNKFTLICDLNFQKKKIKGQEKERREERRMRKERKEVGR